MPPLDLDLDHPLFHAALAKLRADYQPFARDGDEVRSEEGDRSIANTPIPPPARPNPARPGPARPGPATKTNRWPLIILLILMLAGLVAGGLYWFATRNEESTDDAFTDGRAIAIAPHVSGYVTVLAVNDNQFVHKGDLLVQIETKDYVTARDQIVGQIASIDAQIRSAELALRKARTTYPAQLQQARGQLETARGQLYQASSEFKRQHHVARAATSQQSIDQSTAGQRQALGQLVQAQAQVRQAQLIPENIAQAEAQVHDLEGQRKMDLANLAQAEINIGYTRIVAPEDGWITRRNVEFGNYLTAGTEILSLVTPDLWITANFKETQLTRMRPGQRAEIVVDSYPDMKLVGHVDSIQHGTGSKFTAFPPENATGNFVKIVQRVPVKIAIDRGYDRRYPPPLGVSVEPTVTVE